MPWYPLQNLRHLRRQGDHKYGGLVRPLVLGDIAHNPQGTTKSALIIIERLTAQAWATPLYIYYLYSRILAGAQIGPTVLIHNTCPQSKTSKFCVLSAGILY